MSERLSEHELAFVLYRLLYIDYNCKNIISMVRVSRQRHLLGIHLLALCLIGTPQLIQLHFQQVYALTIEVLPSEKLIFELLLLTLHQENQPLLLGDDPAINVIEWFSGLLHPNRDICLGK